MTEVADELDHTAGSRTIIVVGGSLLAWRGLRESTEDVDSIIRFDDELRRAVRVVAKRNQLAADWLNDHAAPFAPRTLERDSCDVLIDRAELLVLGAPLRDVFLMKLMRALPGDLHDLRAMWPRLAGTFTSAAQIVAAMYTAFPDALPDEHLGEFVIDELRKGGFELAAE
jgi:Nucleotidyltransferase of unknown function (DUF6036)